MKCNGILAFAALMMMNTPNFAQEPLPDDVLQKISYGTGLSIAGQLSQNPDLDQVEMVKGFQDAAAQKEDAEKIAYAQGVGFASGVTQRGLKPDQVLKGFQDEVAQIADKKILVYAEGAGIASQIIRRGLKPDQVLKAIQDAAAGTPPPYTEEEMTAANEEAQKFLQKRQIEQQKQQEASQQSAQINLEKGKAFLAENAGKEGVMTTISGLQYQVLKKGEGDKPAKTDTVKVHYTGRLLDGTVFDSSVERGTPVEFPLNQVIPGWTEGLQLMSPGAKYRFWIPSTLAYGEKGPPAIGPNQVLDFEVELLEVK